jgi:4,5-dihydroxyphthalate decarboxylase
MPFSPCRCALAVMLPWLPAELEQIAAVMGPQHWKYGCVENYHVLDALCQYHHEQGLSKERLQPQQLFAVETQDLKLGY